MRILFVCDSGANIYSDRREIIDLEDWGISDNRWKEMTDDEKEKLVLDWANGKLELYWEEV